MTTIMRRLVFLWLLAAPPAFAADAAGQFAVDGVGRLACAEFVEASQQAALGKRERMLTFAGWTDGFLSGVNVFQPATFDITPYQPIEVILAQMRAYCETHPDEPYVTALGKLIAVLEPVRLVTESPLVRAQTGGKAVFVYREVLDRLHARLAQEGDLPADSPREFADPFAAAIRAFQARAGLPQTGLPDLMTLETALAPQPPSRSGTSSEESP